MFCLAIARSVIAFHKFGTKLFAFRREPFNEPANFHFADGSGVDEGVFLFKLLFPTCQLRFCLS